MKGVEDDLEDDRDTRRARHRWKKSLRKCQARFVRLSLFFSLSYFARGTYESCDFTAAFSHRLNSIINHEDPAMENDVPINCTFENDLEKIFYVNLSLSLSHQLIIVPYEIQISINSKGLEQ